MEGSEDLATLRKPQKKPGMKGIDCIGVGGQGSVYRANVTTGEVLAVKKLNQDPDASMMSRNAFDREIHALTEIRHRNIVRLHGFCLSRQHTFLVYEYLEPGSLESILKDSERFKQFDWVKRVNVVKGVANALSYLHHESNPPIIHRDISSKNILLDNEWEARVSDFGTARVLNSDTSSLTSFAGTYGYAAPEMAYTMKATEKSDVYGFGVVALDVFLGQHPGDVITYCCTSGETPSTWQSLFLQHVLDGRISYPDREVVGEVVLVMKMAFSCLSISPEDRPSMRQVSQGLSSRRQLALPTVLNDATLDKLFNFCGFSC
ncbi:hypothetical protein MLD38_022848 [Melastoma candidum]|uniref:Uncharacterized protein n=1 Tax=Melastoma candidum TaxID=119954 RepID=A0ACB9QJS2_9MYRT|nr:hypothetical protein MLD38_022848 [Melastoma candidum]